MSILLTMLPAQFNLADWLVVAVSFDSTSSKVLLAIGILAGLGFVIGVIKSAVKWMFYCAIVGVAAWFFFFQS